MELPNVESISPLPESQSLHHTLEFICIQKIPIELSVVWVTMLRGRNVQTLLSMSSQSTREFALQHGKLD